MNMKIVNEEFMEQLTLQRSEQQLVCFYDLR